MEGKRIRNISEMSKAHGLMRHSVQQLSDPGLTDDACVYVFTGIAEWSKGNRKSDFTETGTCFKEDGYYPPLIELKLKKTASEEDTHTHSHYSNTPTRISLLLFLSLFQPLGK